jgi:hypothetical protein
MINGDTLKQLLARSRYFYTKQIKWSKTKQNESYIIWFVSWHSKAYDLAQDLRNIFEKQQIKL